MTNKPPTPNLGRLLFETAAQAIIILHKQQIVDCNPSAETLFGSTTSQICQHTLLDFSPAEQPSGEKSASVLKKHLQKTAQNGQHRFEWLLQRLDGATFYAQLLTNTLTQGNDTYLQLFIHDITRDKRTREALATSESRSRALLDVITDLMFRLNQDGVFIDYEASAEMAARFQDETFLNRRLEDVFSPEMSHTIRQHLQETLETGEIQYFEYQAPSPDGRHREYEARMVVSGPDEVLTVVRDVTEVRAGARRNARLLERRNRQVRLSTLVAQQIAAAQNIDTLYQQVVNQIKEQFGFYHVQFLRYDAQAQAMQLVAGYGDIGHQMLSQGYQVPLGVGIIGQAAALNSTILQPKLAPEDHAAAEFLPDTQGEIAVPIRRGEESLEAQKIALRHFIEAGFAGFAVAALNQTELQPLVEEALAAGMSAAFINDTALSHQPFHLRYDDYAVGYLLGQQAGQWASAHLPAKQNLNLALFNNPHLEQLRQRESGILAALNAEFKGQVQVVATAQATDSLSAVPRAKVWFKNYPDLHMILSINDTGALAAYAAAQEAGFTDPNRFFIGGIDAVSEAVEAIREGGVFQTTIDLAPRTLGRLTVRSLVGAIANLNYPKDVVIQPQVLNQDSLTTFLAQQRSPLNQKLPAGWDSLDLAGLRVGLSVFNLNNPFYADMVEAAQQEAQRLGLSLFINDPKVVLGVLDVQVDRAYTLDEEDQLMLEGLSGQIAIAFENTRLLQQSNIFRQLVETIYLGVAIADLNGNLIYNNPAAAELFGFTQQGSQPSAQITTFYPPQVQQQITQEIIPQVFAQGEWRGELPIQNYQHEILPSYHSLFLISDEVGQPQYLAGIFSDITDQKLNEAELEARLDQLSAMQNMLQRNAWQNFRQNREMQDLGYAYDATEFQVKPFTAHRQKFFFPTESDSASQNAAQTLTKDIQQGDEVIGLLGVYQSEDHPLSDDERTLIENVSQQVAEALERARLIEQTQDALAEAELLYSTGTELSTATTLNDILFAVLGPGLASGAFFGNLMTIELDDKGEPEWLEIKAAWQRTGGLPQSLGERIYLPDYPVSRMWIDHPDDLLVIEDYDTDPRIPKDTKSIYVELGVKAELGIPLVLNKRWIGIVSINWPKPRHFSQAELRFYKSIGDQTAVVVDNLILLEKSQARTQQLERLSEIEIALSQAYNEAEIVTAMANVFADTIGLTIALYYIEVDDRNQAQSLITVARWQNKRAEMIDPTLRQAQSFQQSLLGQALQTLAEGSILWLGRTALPADLPMAKALLNAFMTDSLIVLPALSLGRWQGALTFSWEGQHPFTEADRFILTQISEPLAAIIATRRAAAAREVALAETENLYRVSAALNTAQSYAETVSILRSYTALGRNAHHISLDYFDHPWTMAQRPSVVEVLVRQYTPGTTPIENLNTTYNLQDYPGIDQVLSARSPTFIKDVASDPRLADSIRQMYLHDFQAVSTLIVPLVVRGQWVGFLNATYRQAIDFSEAEIKRMQVLTNQAAVAIQNLKSLDLAQKQTDQAIRNRRESETLYQIGTRLNQADTLNELLQAAISPGMAAGASSAGLFLFELNQNRQPEWAEVVAVWSGQGPPPVPVGTRFNLSQLPFASLWLSNPNRPTFIEDVRTDDQVDEITRQIFIEGESIGVVIMPLMQASRWLGVIAINWAVPHRFGKREARIYGSIGAQTAVALNNLNLIQETIARATQLETLAQIQNALSQADSEEALITAATLSTTHHTGLRVSLHYIESDERGQPWLLRIMADWQNHGTTIYPTEAAPELLVAESPLARFLTRHPDQATFIPNILESEGLDEKMIALAKKAGFKGMAVLPLYSGRAWQGVLSFRWTEAQTFSKVEKAIFRQLLDPLAAVVATRRAALAQTRALAQSEKLYRLGQQMNEIKTVDKLVNLLADELPIKKVDRISLLLVRHDIQEEAAALQVAAQWHNPAHPELPIFKEELFNTTALHNLPILLSTSPVFIRNAQTDPLLPSATQEFMARYQIKALAIFPLSTGTGQQGVLLLKSHQVYEFTDVDVRPYLSLAPQLASAIENRRLIDETQSALAQVKRTQKRYTLQSWETYRAQSKATFAEVVREGVLPMGDEIPPEFLQAFKARQSLVIKNGDSKPTPPGSGLAQVNMLSAEDYDNQEGSSLVVPLTMRDEVIGILGLQETGQNRTWTPEEIALVEAISEQLAQTAESLRLLDESQQRAAREQRVNAISERIDAAQSLEEALQVALQEVSQALQSPETRIDFNLDE